MIYLVVVKIIYIRSLHSIHLNTTVFIGWAYKILSNKIHCLIERHYCINNEEHCIFSLYFITFIFDPDLNEIGTK